jgi:hypothetical protein
MYNRTDFPEVVAKVAMPRYGVTARVQREKKP